MQQSISRPLVVSTLYYIRIGKLLLTLGGFKPLFLKEVSRLLMVKKAKPV